MPYDFLAIKDRLIERKSVITVHFHAPRNNRLSSQGVYMTGNTDFISYKPFDDIIEEVTCLNEIRDEVQVVLAGEIKDVEISCLIAP